MKRIAFSIAVLTTLGMLIWHSPARAETISEAYSKALKAYYAGQYAEAARGFERIVALPLHHEDVFYNLGCADYRLGRLGPAIYNFERALALDSGFEDAHYNLDVARAAVAKQVKDVLKGGADRQPWWVATVDLMSAKAWWALVLVLWWVVVALVLVLRRTAPGPTRAALVTINAFLVLLLVGSAGLLAGRLHLDTGVSQAIVLPDRAAVHEGPDSSSKTSFKLHAGLRLRVTGQVSGWDRVRLANGLEGWMSARDLGHL